MGIVAESVREKAARKEKDLADKGSFELSFMRRNRPGLMQRLTGDSDYGTSLGKGAAAAESSSSQAEWEKGKSLREMEPEVRQAMREAAAEERREAKESRKYKSGGKVSASKRADGCAQRGKTRGKMV